MSCSGHAMERYAGTLRAWHLAILRYAVTRDNADRLAVFRIALEIDSLEPGQEPRQDDGGFDFFRRTSAELCTAILQPNARASAILQQYLARIDDDRFKRALAAAIDASEPAVSPAGRAVGRGNDLWKGLASRKPLTTQHCCGAGSGSYGGLTRRRPMRGREVLLPPFRSGTAHVVFLWMVSLGRPIPGRTEKRHHRPDDTAQQRDKDGPIHRECSPGPNYAPPSYCRADRNECREARVRAASGAPSSRRWPRSWSSDSH